MDWLAGLGGSSGARRERLAGLFGPIHDRGEVLLARMWEGLASIPGVRLYGAPPGAPRTPTVAFTVDGASSEAVALHLASRGIFASHGDFYAATVIARYGRAPDGVVRAGCAIYTTEDEVERLLDAVRTVPR